MRKSEFKPDGLGYMIVFPEIATTFSVDHLRVSSGDTKGHVMVRSEFPGARTYADGLVHYSQENLSSGTARRAMGKMLDDKIPTDPNLDWFGMYDEFCTMVMMQDRKGAPADEAGMQTKTFVSRMLLDPVVLFGVHSILFGRGGLGKSALAVGSAVSVRTGREVIPGFLPRETGEVLYLNYETNVEDIDARVKAVCRGIGIKPVRIWHMSGRGRPLYTQAERIAREMDREGSVMIIVDSSGKAMGTSENGPAEGPAERFTAALDEIGRSALCLDHVSGDGLKFGSHKPYGSIMKENWARQTWEMTQARDPDGLTSHLVLTHIKKNMTSHHEPIGLSMTWSPDGSAVTWDREMVVGGGMPDGTFVDQIAWALTEHPLRTREIAARLGQSEDSIRVTLNRHKERFTKIPTGDWALLA